MVRAEGVPHHREAYPRFDIVQAQAAMERDASAVCVFSQDRMVMGHLIISDVDAQSDDLTIDYFINGPYVKNCTSQQYIRLKSAPSGVFKYRKSVLCPACERSTFNLYYVEAWACAECHELTYLSKLVGKEAAASDRQYELSKLVGRGRPKHMRNATYAQLTLELRDLNLWLRNRTFVANEIHSLKMVAEWKAAADVGELWIPNYVVRQGQWVRVELPD